MDIKRIVILTLILTVSACTHKPASQSQTTSTPLPTIASTSAPTEASTIPGKNETELPLTVPPNILVSTYTKNLASPRVIIFDTNNTALVSIPTQNKVIAIKDGGQSQKDLIIGLNAPHGLALEGDMLYIGETDGVSKYTYNVDRVTATNGQKIMILPTGGRHTTKSVHIINTASGKKLLTSIGSSCDVCEEKDSRRGSILISDLDGKNSRVYAAGLRNSVFLAENPTTQQIWATEMGRDFLGDDLPPDEVNILQDGKNYGWPLCYGQNIHDSDFDKKVYIDNPCKEPGHTASHIDLPGHSAPLGLAFTPTSWPTKYQNSLLIAFHGSWNRTQPTGYKIVRYQLDQSGNFKSKEDFITGWLGKDGKAIGRPAGMQFDNNGNLYITDDKLGNIYKVSILK